MSDFDLTIRFTNGRNGWYLRAAAIRMGTGLFSLVVALVSANQLRPLAVLCTASLILGAFCGAVDAKPSLLANQFRAVFGNVTGRWGPNFAGTTEALAALLALLCSGPLPVYEGTPRVLASAAAILFAWLCVAQWVVDAAWYRPSLRIKVPGAMLVTVRIGIIVGVAGLVALLYVDSLWHTHDSDHWLPSYALVPGGFFLGLACLVLAQDSILAAASASAAILLEVERISAAAHVHSTLKQQVVALAGLVGLNQDLPPKFVSLVEELVVTVETTRRELLSNTRERATSVEVAVAGVTETLVASHGAILRVEVAPTSDAMKARHALVTPVITDLVSNALNTGARVVTLRTQLGPGETAPVLVIDVLDPGSGPDEERWLTDPEASSTVLDRLLRGCNGALEVLREERHYVGIRAKWELL